MGDDFCIDEDREVLYLTTHRQNTIDRVSIPSLMRSRPSMSGRFSLYFDPHELS
jgi:hypothetical protein